MASDKFEVKEKAWEVKDPTAWEHSHPDEDWQVVYAKTAGEAKSMCREKNDFVSVIARRAKACDKILFEGDILTRDIVSAKIQVRKTIEERTAKVMRYPEDTLFYIQNGYCGNCVMWWGLNSAGYTSNIRKAQKYTRAEVLERFVKTDITHRIWVATEVEAKIVETVDSQYLDHSFVS